MGVPVISIIGAGNMGACLVGGLIKSGHPTNKLWAASPNQEKLSYLKKTFHIHTTTHNPQAIESASVVIFAVKPGVFPEVAHECQPIISHRSPLILSVMTGIKEHTIRQYFGEKISIVRAMPNTPALIGAGATALFANSHVTKSQADIAESILRAVGIIVWLKEESLLNVVTTLSGSGPAYFFYIMEILQKTAINLGLSEETAALLIKQTALGSARIAIESNDSLATLRQKVTSPGGTTEKAIAVFEKHQLQDIIKQAIQAAFDRAKELGDKNA